MFLKPLQTLPFSCLVDMGCGTGEFLVELAGVRPAANFIGIDIDAGALSEALSRARASLLTSGFDLV